MPSEATSREPRAAGQRSYDSPAPGTVTPGTFGFSGQSIDVQLPLYDRRSFELSWTRVPGAIRYRPRREGQVVQESARR